MTADVGCPLESTAVGANTDTSESASTSCGNAEQDVEERRERRVGARRLKYPAIKPRIPPMSSAERDRADADRRSEVRAPQIARLSTCRCRCRRRRGGGRTLRKPWLGVAGESRRRWLRAESIGTKMPPRMTMPSQTIASHAPMPSRCDRGRRRPAPSGVGRLPAAARARARLPTIGASRCRALRILGSSTG